MFVALKVAYHSTYGTHHGWQIQPNLRTIEGDVRRALLKSGLVCQTSVEKLTYAGRTDQGVNAIGQTVAVELVGSSSTIPDRFLHRLNHYLPQNIRFWAFTAVPDSFHPRYQAVRRIYRYVWYNPSIKAVHVTRMRQAAHLLVGEHDFRNFSKNDDSKPTIITKRSLDDIKLSFDQPGVLVVQLEAPSFLWQQCRRITSHLLEVGFAKADLATTKALLEGDPKTRPLPMPPEHLTLVDVIYEGLCFVTDTSVLEKMMMVLNKELQERARLLHSLEGYSHSLSGEIDVFNP